MLPAFVERYNFHRRFEPAGNVVLHGAGQDPGVGNRYDPSAFHAYWQAMPVEQRPTLYMSYVPLKADMPTYFRRLRQALAVYQPYQAPSRVPQKDQCVLDVPGQRVVCIFEITNYEPNRRIAFHGDRPAMAKPERSMTLESVEGGTQVTLVPRPEFSGIFKLLEPLLARYIEKQNTTYLQTLK
jgi:hypothetical protein